MTKKIAPAKDTLAAAAKIEKQMGGEWKQAFFELITNFPNDVENTSYKCNLVPEGVRVTIYQDGSGTNMKVVEKNRTTDSDDLSIDKVKTRDNGGSMFGIGTANIDYHVLGYKFKCREDNSDFEVWDVSTGDVTIESLDVDDKWKVIQEFTITDRGGVTYQEKLETFKRIIGYVDAMAIDSGYKHTFEVTGFGEEVDKSLSGDVEPAMCIWDDTDKSGRPTPKHKTLFKKDKTPIREVVVEALDHSEKTYKIKLKVLGLGKRKERNDLFYGIKNIKDIPYLIIYLNKGRKQLVGRIPLRNLTGKKHLNNVMLVVTVSKDDIRKFFASPDKFKGFVESFEKAIKEQLVPIIENTYEDNDTKEKVRQLFLYDIIVYDKFGDNVYEDEANAKRKLLGIDFLNNLPISKREELVTMEAWTTKSARLDILVRHPIKYNSYGEDVYTIIEMKKEDFNVLAIRQGTDYVQKVKGAVQLYGVSVGIAEGNYASFKAELAEINASNQRRLNDLNGDLIDLNKHGFMFSTFEQYYRELVEQKMNDLKDD